MSNIIGWIAIGLLGVRVLVLAYNMGRSDGYERRRGSCERREMVQVPYPESLEEAEKKRGER